MCYYHVVLCQADELTREDFKGSKVRHILLRIFLLTAYGVYFSFPLFYFFVSTVVLLHLNVSC